jgi:hypothetical protein
MAQAQVAQACDSFRQTTAHFPLSGISFEGGCFLLECSHLLSSSFSSSKRIFLENCEWEKMILVGAIYNGAARR